MSARKLALNGSPSFKTSARNSEPTSKDRRLIQLLRPVFNQHQKLADPESHRHALKDFIFHMTDWKADLRKLAELYEHPGRFDADSAGHAVAGFLMHALAHLRAASMLMLDDDGSWFVDGSQSLSDSASAKT